MRRIAIQTLLHRRLRFVGAVLGVGVVVALVLAQLGLYAGFSESAARPIRHAGGDVWIVSRGTEVFDDGEALSGSAAALLAGHPCVRRVRGLVVDYRMLRRPSGGLTTIQVVGLEPSSERPFPWTFARGLPADLAGPERVAVDEMSLDALGVPGEPIGAELDFGDQTVFVGALTRGIRSFTLTPYVFADLALARQLARLPEDQATYFLADLYDRACVHDVVRRFADHPDLEAHPTAEFAAMTRDYWVSRSGIGTLLVFGALLALGVGVVVTAQVLNSVVSDHLRELATLRALGATLVELGSFVGWQVAVLAALGGGIGLGVTVALAQILAEFGLLLALSPSVVAVSALGLAAMCALASASSLRALLRMSVPEVLAE